MSILKNIWTESKKQLYVYIGIFIVFVLLIIAILIIDLKTVVGFIGVVIGGLISSVTTLFIERWNYQRQLRLAALDKRLEVHQKAYSIWRKIMTNIYNNELGNVVREAQNWWENNCLYLGAKSRGAFFNCLMFATNHADILKARTPNYNYKQEILESWGVITLPGKTLVEEVNLPSFGDKEYIEPEKESKKGK